MATSDRTKAKWGLFAEAYVLTGCGKEAAKQAGYKGKPTSLAVAGSRLLRNPVVRDMIAKIKRELKAQPIPINPAVAEQMASDQAARKTVRVETEDKRSLLWEVACHNGRVVCDEDIQEEIDDEGCTTRIITRTERVFDSQGCINAVLAMSQLDGDIKAPGAATGGGLSIENLLLSIGQ